MQPSSDQPLSRVPRAIAATASLEFAPVAVLWVDREGRIGYANARFQEVLGWSAEETIGQDISHFATFWTASDWQDTVWPKAEEGQLESLEGNWQASGDAESVVLKATLKFLKIAGQTMLSVYLEDPPRGTPKRPDTEASYSDFLDHVPSGVCLVDAQLNLLRSNPAISEITGISRNEIIGRNVAELFPPADDETESRWEQLSSVSLKDWPLKFRNASGHVFDLVISSHAAPVAGRKGKPEFFITVQDVSERVQLKRMLDQHEHSFEHLARNTPGMIYKFVISPDGHASFPYASPGCHDIWEISPEKVRDDASPVIELVHPDDVDRFQSSVMKSASDLTPWEFEGRMVTPSGKEKWFHAASRPELAENGDIVWQGLLMDVTHQKQIEEELKEAKRKAESAARSKADFLANMSHEIRTPMNGVIGMSELLANTELAPRQEHYVETIRSSAEVLLAIINDILDISKMEAGKLLIHLATFDMRRMLDDVATLLAPRAFDKGIELIVRYAPGAPNRVVGDAVRLRQILTNLIGNAIKFTAEGHVLVQVTESERRGDRALIKFSVADTGIGISPEAKQRLFKNFEQEDSSTSRKFGGTGLGLAISRQLVELMEGKLEVESELEKGSNFHFSLEFEIADQGIDDEIEPLNLGALRILSVDDHPVNREVLSDLFNAWGIRHTEAARGKEALKILRKAALDKDPYDVAILDFQMPEMDGVFLASAIRAEPEINDVIILMLSSASFRDDQQRELAQAGVAGQMLKPLRQFELHEMLGNAVAARKGNAPVIKGPEKEKEETPPRMETPIESKGCQALLAEDNEVNIEIAVEMLQTLGLKVDCAMNGAEAVSMVKEKAYDFIFMDCQMPEMDGFEATRVIRGLKEIAQPVIIAMTSHAMAGDRERCLDSGMDDYLSKPVTFERLESVIREYLEKATEQKDQSAAPGHSHPLFDLDAALAVTGGNRQVLGRALEIWWRKVPEWLAGLRTAFDSADLPTIKAVAHTMRGASSNIGATSVGKAAEEIEIQVTSENLPEMRQVFDALVADLERLKEVANENRISEP